MLRWRLIGAASIIVPVLGMLWLDEHHHFGRPGIWFAILVSFFGVACSFELVAMFNHHARNCVNRRLLSPTTVGIATILPMLLVVVAAIFPPGDASCRLGSWGWTVLATLLAMAVIVGNELRTFAPNNLATERVAVSILIAIYMLIPFSFIIHLRMLWLDRRGLVVFAGIVFIAKVADAGAYFVGRSMGKRKLAPVLSPKKTVEGAIGGLLCAIVAAIFYLQVIAPYWTQGLASPMTGSQFGWVAMIGFGLAISIAGMLGDLAISLFKRDAGQKDSANVLPGLGGFMDIIDSVLWAAPVGYLWWIAFWIS